MPPKNDNLPVQSDPELTDGGTITYANEVIAIISGIAANEIEGIAGMVTSGGFGDIIGKNRNITRGVKVEVGTEEVSVDLYTTVEYGQPIQKVASEVQENVRKSIESMTGLHVARVDIHVQGVSFEKDKQEAQSRLEAANVQNLISPKQEKKNKKAEKETKAAEAKLADAAVEAKQETQPQTNDLKEEPLVLDQSVPDEGSGKQGIELPNPLVAMPETNAEPNAVESEVVPDSTPEVVKPATNKKPHTPPSKRRKA